LGPQRKKERTLAALFRQLEAMARRQPALIVFEDLHWIDPTSREFLDSLVEGIERLPVLLVATCRPEFQAPWTDLPPVTLVVLNRLGRRDAAAMARRVAGDTKFLSQGVVDEIVERTNGVPLFVEELTKAVLESGSDRNAQASTFTSPPSIVIPATLHASLMARLDRLGPVAQHVAQVGSAIGKEFSCQLVATAGQLSEPLIQGELQRLVEAGLLFQHGSPPHATFVFKHALLQDIAYSTLLRQAREDLHGRIAAALEQQFPGLAGSQPELLAYHFAEAGNPIKAAGY